MVSFPDTPVLLAESTTFLVAQAIPFLIFSLVICCGVFLAMAIIASPLLLATLRWVTLRNAFKGLAQRTIGTYFSNGLLHAPEVAFRKNEVLFRVRMTRSRLNRLSRILFITANWPDRSFRMRVVPSSVDLGASDTILAKDVRTGDLDFDKRFVLQSNEEDKLLTLFSEPVKTSLRTFLAKGASSEFEIRVIGGVMSLRYRAKTSTSQLLQSHVDRFVGLYQLMLAARALAHTTPPLGADEIEYVSSSNRTLAIDGDGSMDVMLIQEERIPVCQVCGTDIERQRVDCRSCDTAHHRDCWEYLGKCSTFACGEHRFWNAGQKKRIRKRKQKHG